MKISRIGLISLISLFSSVQLYSQTHNSFDLQPPSMVNYNLVENKTYSFREINGVRTFKYDSMASYNTRAYTEGYLAHSNYGPQSNGYTYDLVNNYRLMFPRPYSETYTDGYPLLIMLHGAGERANCAACCGNCYQWTANWSISRDNPDQIPASNIQAASRVSTGVKAQLLNNDYNLNLGGQTLMNSVIAATGKLPNDPTLLTKSWPGFLLFPQMMNEFWYQPDLDAVVIMVKLMIQKYNIDPNRIFVHGLSAGGEGTFGLIRTAPWLIAGALPMAALNDDGLISGGTLDKTASIPIWQFHGGQDPTASPSLAKANYNTFLNYGMDIKLTIYPTLKHSVWNEAWAEPNFFPWIMSKNKANILVRYGNPTICPSSGKAVELRVGAGFYAYQWQKDGQTVANNNPDQTRQDIFFASTPGTYRARFSRINNPTESQWNRWSDPVVVRDGSALVPVIQQLGSVHYPDGVTNTQLMTLKGPDGYRYYHWYKNGDYQYPSAPKDTIQIFKMGNGADGVITLKVGDLQDCQSSFSPPIAVKWWQNDPINLAAPSGLKGVVTSATSINIFWTDNSNNETGFEVYRALSTSTNYKFVGLTSEDAISFLDTGLKPDSTYKYVVRTVSNSARSNYSSAFTISTVSDTQPPTAPQNLKVISTVFTGTNSTSITLAWSPSTDNSGIKDYQVSYAGSSSGGPLTPAVPNDTTITITNLSRNRSFTFTVVARDLALIPNVSSPSNQVYAETVTKGLNYIMSEGAWNTLYPSTQSGVTVNNVTWTKIENIGTADVVSIAPRKQDDFFYLRFEGFLTIPFSGTYNFYLNAKTNAALYIGGTNLGLPSSLYPNVSSTTNNRVANGDQNVQDGVNYVAIETPGSKTFSTNGVYPISVIYNEYSGAGETLSLSWEKTTGSGQFAKVEIPASAYISGTTSTPLNVPTIPTSVTAVNPGLPSGLSSLTVSWAWTKGVTAPNSGTATGYEVYRASSASGPFTIIAQITPNTTKTFADTGLKAGTTYYYQVKAVITGNGSSDFSSVASGTTGVDTTPPSVPTSLVLQSQSFTDAALSWTASTDDVLVALYNVYANGVLIGISTTTTYAATGLTPGASYNFTVSAKDGTGNESAQSTPVSTSTNTASTYYYDGSGALNSVTNWGAAPNGTGTNPPNFDINGQYFIVANTTSTALGGSTWTVSGNVSKIIVSSGTTLTLDNALVGKISAQSGATINVNYDANFTFDVIDPAATVNFNTYSTVPQSTYGNLNLGGAGTKVLAAGTTLVKGNLTLANGVTLKGIPLNGSAITLSGNFTNGTPATVPSDEYVSLRMDGTNAAQITTTGSLPLYLLNIAANKTVTFNNTSGSPKDVSLGSENGGGLLLENGSVFQIGSNNLLLNFASTVNPGGQTGQLDVSGGNINFTSSAAANSTFNFGPSGKTVSLFTLNLTGASAAATIGQSVTLTNALKIKQGIFNANGNVTLESNASGTASIREIENGGVINGAVTVKRYAAAQGPVYRYVSFPVANVKVADLQNYVPINGSFSGANSGGTSTLYKYTTDWVKFPKSSNQETFDQGRGYSFLNQGGASPTLWQSTGVPYQGIVTFNNLTGGSVGSGTGWNLVGNPYACPIVWDNTSNWQTSGLGSTIYIRNNHGTTYEWQYWNTAVGNGTLPGGKIPSGQAFWIQATNAAPSLVVKESAKSADDASSNTNFYRESTTSPFGTFTFTLSGNGMSDPAFLYINSTGKDAFDKASDSEKRSNSYFNLSTFSSDSVKLAINQLSDAFSSCQKMVGLTFDNTPAGQYTLHTDVASWKGPVSLKDRFLNTTVSMMEGDSYSFSVTSDPKSYGKNRFTLLLSNPALDVTSPVLSTASGSLCAGGLSTVVSLKNSQQGVRYTVEDNAGNAVSEPIVSSGEQIDFTIAEQNFNEGVNGFHLQAEWNGCTSAILPTTVTIAYSTSPIAVVKTEKSMLCAGETTTLTATGALTNGSYRWYEVTGSNQVLRKETGDKIFTTPFAETSSMTYLVQAISQYGCEGTPKPLTIISTAIAAPTVSQSGNIFYSSSDHNNQWLKDGQPITDMTGISYQPAEPGVYSVRITIAGCSKDSEPINYLVNGIEHPVTGDSYFTVYPNPTNQHNLQLRGNIYGVNADEVSIELIDTNGRVHLSTQFSIEDINNGVKLDTSSENLSSGVYLVVMKLGSIITKKKVMIN